MKLTGELTEAAVGSYHEVRTVLRHFGRGRSHATGICSLRYPLSGGARISRLRLLARSECTGCGSAIFLRRSPAGPHPHPLFRRIRGPWPRFQGRAAYDSVLARSVPGRGSRTRQYRRNLLTERAVGGHYARSTNEAYIDWSWPFAGAEISERFRGLDETRGGDQFRRCGHDFCGLRRASSRVSMGRFQRRGRSREDPRGPGERPACARSPESQPARSQHLWRHCDDLLWPLDLQIREGCRDGRRGLLHHSPNRKGRVSLGSRS